MCGGTEENHENAHQIAGLQGKAWTHNLLHTKQYYPLTLMFSPHLQILTFNIQMGNAVPFHLTGKTLSHCGHSNWTVLWPAAETWHERH
jgi:hypothetical protein